MVHKFRNGNAFIKMITYHWQCLLCYIWIRTINFFFLNANFSFGAKRSLSQSDKWLVAGSV